MSAPTAPEASSSPRKDKKKVVGEAMTDDQIRVFLNYPPEAGEDPDFHVLLKAYRALREDDFARFLDFFAAEGRNINARSINGQTLLELIASHRQGEGYRQALREAGAA